MKKFLLLVTSLSLVSCAELNSALDSVNKSMEGISNSTSKNYQSVSAQKICKDLRENEITATKKWVGSYVSVKGKVDSVYQSEWGETVVSFTDNRVRLSASLKDAHSAEKIKAGNIITVKGVVRGFMDTGHCNISLENAYF